MGHITLVFSPSPSPPLFLRDFPCYVCSCYPASKEARRQKPRSTTRSRLVKSLLEACPQALGGDSASPPWPAVTGPALRWIHSPAARVLRQTRVLAPAGAPAQAAAAPGMWWEGGTLRNCRYPLRMRSKKRQTCRQR